MEVGAGLNKNGMDVTIVFPEKHLMERLFTPEIAQFYEQYYQDKGRHIEVRQPRHRVQGQGWRGE